MTRPRVAAADWKHCRRRAGLLLVAGLAFSAAWAAPAQEPAEPQGEGGLEKPGGLTPQEARGRQIYRTGTTEDGAEVTALMGEALIEVPATALPCSSCHGLDGKGRPEGGVSPTDLTWGALTRPYGVRHPSGREHPPYDARLVKRAISMGIDPAGNKLHVAMPRYRMQHGDLEALVAYLQTIDSDRDPGVDERAVTLGMLLPPPGAAGPFGEVLGRIVAKTLEQVNDGGGIYGRELRLLPFELPSDPAARRQAVASFLEEEAVFALAPSFFAGADEELAALATELGMPVVAPVTLNAEESSPVNRHVFYLWSGIAGQGRALARFVLESAAQSASESDSPKVGGLRVAIISPADGRLASPAEAISAELDSAAEVEIVRLGAGEGEDPAGVAARLAARGVADLFLLETGAPGLALLEAADAAAWKPRVLVPGSLAGRSLLHQAQEFGGSLLLAYPTLPGDRRGRAAEEMRKLSAELSLPPGTETLVVPVFAGVRLLIEGLERSGRELSRERLIAALEGLYDYPTWLTPALTFGPNRRVGARGSYVVAVTGEDLSARGGGWVPVDR